MDSPDAVLRIKRDGALYRADLESGEEAILADLYGYSSPAALAQSSREELTFGASLTLGEAAAHVCDVAKNLGYEARVREAGRRVDIWAPVPEREVPRMIELRVDLKWSLWSQSLELWHERAPEAVAAMREAIAGVGPPVRISTAPRKAIRYGTVEVHRGQARIEFRVIWDAPYDLVPSTVSDEMAGTVEEALVEWIEGRHGFWDDYEMPVAALVETAVEADGLLQMLEKIDEMENELLEEARAASRSLDHYLQEVMRSLTAPA